MAMMSFRFGLALIIAVPLAVAFVLAILIAVALGLFLSRTNLGRAIRATSQNPEASVLMGIDVEMLMRKSIARCRCSVYPRS